MDFECFAARTLPASPQAVYRATALPLPERARVLKLALATLQKLSVAGAVLPGGVLTKCSSLVPLGAPTVVGVSARPSITACTSQAERASTNTPTIRSTTPATHRSTKPKPSNATT